MEHNPPSSEKLFGCGFGELIGVDGEKTIRKECPAALSPGPLGRAST
jgi:hypothetical protein